MDNQALFKRIELIEQKLWEAGVAFGNVGEKRLWSISPEPLTLPMSVFEQMQQIASSTPLTFGLAQSPYYVRFDLTVDSDNKVWILEANEIPVGDHSVDVNRKIYNELGYVNDAQLPGNIVSIANSIHCASGSCNIAIVVPDYRMVYVDDYIQTAKRLSDLGHPTKVVSVEDFDGANIDLIYRIFTLADYNQLPLGHPINTAVTEGTMVFPSFAKLVTTKEWMSQANALSEFLPFSSLINKADDWQWLASPQEKSAGWVIKPAGTNWGAKGVTISSSSIKLWQWQKAIEEAIDCGGYILQKYIPSQKYQISQKHTSLEEVVEKSCNVRICLACLVEGDQCTIMEVDAALSHRTVVHGGVETVYVPVYFN